MQLGDVSQSVEWGLAAHVGLSAESFAILLLQSSPRSICQYQLNLIFLFVCLLQ